MKSARFFSRRALRRALPRRAPARSFRPLGEQLEARQLLAFNVTLSGSATNAAVQVDNSIPGTRIFRAINTGANVALSDIAAAMAAPNSLNVIVDSGSTGTQAGNITSTVDASAINGPNTNLTLRSGTGTGLVGDINIAALSFSNSTSSLTIVAAHDVVLNSPTSSSFTVTATGTMTITAGGAITMPITSQLVASSLSLTAQSGIGVSGTPIFTRVDSLTSNSAGGNGNQFITQQSKGLTGLNLAAGAGAITLVVSTGAVTDADGSTDIAAGSAAITQNGSGQNFGSAANPIQTSVDDLTVTTAGTGGQFITEASGLTGLNLTALTGTVTLLVSAGSVADGDASNDISTAAANVTLGDIVARDFGSAANPIHTSVNDLTVSTATGNGSQFITEFNGLTALNLSAGTGNVALTLGFGALTDADASTDITATAASVTLTDSAAARDVGSSASPMATSVSDLSIDTSKKGGSQFVSNTKALTGLNLSAGTGNITLLVANGSVADSDALADLAGGAVSATLSDALGKFGTAASPINTAAASLTVDTSAGIGDQFISQGGSLTGLNLKANQGGVTLNVTSGGVADSDAATDITANAINVTLSDPAAQNFGSAANSIGVNTSDLTVTTAAGGGSQFITSAAVILQALNLNAGAGNVTLATTLGFINDSDFSVDVTAASAKITTSGVGGPRPLQTSVDDLTVDTSATNGGQSIEESNGFTGLNLNAGGGIIILTVDAGAVADTDAATDITAASASITLSDATAKDVGSATNPIGTSVNQLTVGTSTGGGNQFFSEANGLTGFAFDAGAGDVVLTAALGSVTDSTAAGTDVTATILLVILNDPTPQSFGTAATPITTAVSSLTINTSAGGGSQFVTNSKALTGLNLNAGAGDVTFVVSTGALSDSDGSADIAAGSATVTLNDPTAKDFGSSANPIAASVSSLSISTAAGGGSQFTSSAGTLSGLNLSAGTGNVALTLVQGFVGDIDPAVDITAAVASVVLSDATAKDFGSAANPIRTSVNDLSVSTAAGGGNQFITESSSLTALSLDAGAGNVTLVVSAGAVNDVDASDDITGNVASITLSGTTTSGFGSAANPIRTSVNDLAVNTNAGNSSQFINEANGLTALNLNAGIGNVTLNVGLGSVTDSDPDTDITATLMNVTLADPTSRDFGSAANPIGTDVFEPTVNTATGGGSQFLSNSNHINALSLNAGSGNVTLVIPSVPGVLLDVEDADPDVDIMANAASITLSKPSHQNVGSPVNRISVNVNDLSIDTSVGGGDQFVTSGKGLTALNLNAGSGIVNVTVTTGSILDADPATDIVAGSATIGLADPAAHDFGAGASPIGTSVSSLLVFTLAGGNQFITNSNDLTALTLNAGTGKVTLNVAAGSISDSDAQTDITASSAAVTLSDPALQDFGSAVNPIQTSVDSLTVNTAAGNGNQFITEASGLTALNLNAGTGNVTLNVTAGSVADADLAADITASAANVMLGDATAQAFGALDPINTSVSDLTVNTAAGGGDQYISQASGLTGLNLNAGAGNVVVSVVIGSVTDADAAADITGNLANLFLADSTPQSVGSAAKAIDTSVSGLTVGTLAGNGDQFISEASGLTALSLNAGTGNISLTLAQGTVADTDAANDITGGTASVTLLDQAVQNFGTSVNPIGTSVNDLTVDTSAGGGNQCIAQVHELNGLNLSAGASIVLALASGGISDSDAAVDIAAGTATVTLNDVAPRSFGSAANPIGVSTGALFVNTSAGNGDQFIADSKALVSFNLNAGTGNVTLTVAKGGLSKGIAPLNQIVASAAAITLSDATAQDVGAPASGLFPISVNDLSIDTSAGGGNQYILQQKALTGLNLNAGTGNVNLTLSAGGIADTDPDTDLTAGLALVLLNDDATKDFGSPAQPIGTSVNGLTVDDEFGTGNQYISEANGLAGLNLFAGYADEATATPAGTISLVVKQGAVADPDSATDVLAATVNIVLGDAVARNLGSASLPIQTHSNSLSVSTAAGGGNQFIDERTLIPLAGLNLSAGTGNITANILSGVADSDADNDISGSVANITCGTSGLAASFGTAADSVGTSVNRLTVHTSAGGGNQFIAEQDSLTADSLDAGEGTITLTGGTFNLAAGNAIGDSSTLIVNSPAVVNLADSDEMAGALAGDGTVTFNFDGISNTLTIGGNNASTVFSGSFTGDDSAGGTPLDNVAKIGTGSLTLSGNSSFTGGYLTQGGTLVVSGTIAASPVHVAVTGDGTTLGGTGSIRRSIDLASGTHLAPGASPGALATGDLNFAVGSSYDVEIASSTAGSFDQINVAGSLALAVADPGVALNLTPIGTATIHQGDRFIVVNNDGSDPITGTFAGLGDGATISTDFLGSGLAARISYAGGDGNDVAIVVNNTPAITSGGGGATATASVPEHLTAVMTVIATDADTDQTLTYGISGGADAAKFAIDPIAGALSFKAAPNFEAPTDAGADNIYDVIVQASDGFAVATQAIAVTVTNANDPPSFVKGPDLTVTDDRVYLALATTITFDGLSTHLGDGDLLQPYTEGQFTVTPATGRWMIMTTESPTPGVFGNPQPSTWEDTNTASLDVTRSSGGSFTFDGLDLTRGTSYTLSGFLGTSGVFTISGAVPSSSSTDFVTVSTTSAATIDRLHIALVRSDIQTTNVDNIRVTGAQPWNGIPAWATDINPGAADETGQGLTFHVTPGDPSLFTAGPIIDAAGKLTFTPKPNAHGSTTVTVSLTDDGGTASGGIDISAIETFTITIIKPHVWHNTLHRFDVDGNGQVVAKDALDVINRLNTFGPGSVPVGAAYGPLFYDTDNNELVTPKDALDIINFLNTFGPGGTGPDGEGEAGFGALVPAAEPTAALDDLIALLAFDTASHARRLPRGVVS